MTRSQTQPGDIGDLVFHLESTAIQTSLHVAYCTTNSCLEHPNSEGAPIAEQYCDTGVCGDGCLRRWPDLSGYIPPGGFSPPEYTIGRNFGQDDAEKPCYISNGINGKPSVKGGAPYGDFDQDKYLEMQTSDIIALSQDFSIFLLCKPINQTANGVWSYFGLATSKLRHDVSNNSLNIRIDGTSSAAQLTQANAVALDAWQLIEIHRDSGDMLTSYIDLQDVTNGPITRSGTMRIGYLFSDFKTTGSGAMYGEIAAFLVYDRKLNTTEVATVRSHLNDEFCLGFTLAEDGQLLSDYSKWLTYNKNTSQLIVDTRQLEGQAVTSVTVYDLSGRQVHQYQSSEPQVELLTLSMKALEQICVVKVTTTKRTFVGKVYLH